MTATTEVLSAAEHLVHCFGTGELDGYFASFEPDTTFVFHTTDRVMTSVAEYREEWSAWEREDQFRVLWCRSNDQRVQVHGDVAIFTHRVLTRAATTAGETEAAERETIVFHRQGDGNWLGVHEHLSLDPASRGQS